MSHPRVPPDSEPAPSSAPASPRLSSTLVMTPQLQLAVRLLGATPCELARLVEGEAAQNPALELTPAPVDEPEDDAVIASVDEGRVVPRPVVGARLVEPAEGSTEEQRVAARWLVRALEQRERTVLRVLEALLERQRDYLCGQRGRPAPLTRREIAELLGIHESTVARIVERKQMRCDRGVVTLADLLKR